MILTLHFLEQLIYTTKADLPEYLPKSLESPKIIRFNFVQSEESVVTKKHNSMLIHAALLVKWIDRAA
jgi:hypothetical protein